MGRIASNGTRHAGRGEVKARDFRPYQGGEGQRRAYGGLRTGTKTSAMQKVSQQTGIFPWDFPGGFAPYQSVSGEASDYIGRKVSGSAMVRALLRYAEKQEYQWVLAQLCPMVEEELSQGVI